MMGAAERAHTVPRACPAPPCVLINTSSARGRSGSARALALMAAAHSAAAAASGDASVCETARQRLPCAGRSATVMRS